MDKVTLQVCVFICMARAIQQCCHVGFLSLDVNKAVDIININLYIFIFLFQYSFLENKRGLFKQQNYYTILILWKDNRSGEKSGEKR